VTNVEIIIKFFNVINFSNTLYLFQNSDVYQAIFFYLEFILFFLRAIKKRQNKKE